MEREIKMKKRYAIVRVDKEHYLNSCPAGFEEINNDFVCSYKKDNILNQYVCNCKNCRYGDTKEQLIRKVAQILKQQMFILEVYEDYIGAAKNIVEFLGIKD